MPSDPIRHLIAQLTDLGGQRVWSLLVSVFGDLAQEKGAGIDGPVLSMIMARMDVRPEATRVALHRLRNDGWITSRKTGRTSNHSLTDHGRAETIAASKRIYATPEDAPQPWQIILTETADSGQRDHLIGIGFAALTSRVFYGAASIRPPNDALCLQGDAIPDWFRAQITPSALAADYGDLQAILIHIADNLPDGTALSPLNRAVLRCLIVHNWRRLVLRHPDLPAMLYTPQWPEPECRRLVHTLLFPDPA